MWIDRNMERHERPLAIVANHFLFEPLAQYTVNRLGRPVVAR